MKKFFFSFLVLVAATWGMTGQAENKFYIDDLLITPEDIGSTLIVPVKASFGERVNFWDLTITLPDGLVLAAVETGQDFPMVYNNHRPDFWYANERFIAYDLSDNHNYCWNAGQYDQMLTLLLNVTEDYNGGSIVIHSQSACRYDPLSGPYTATNRQNFDANGDGEVNIADVNRVIDAITSGYYSVYGDCDSNGIYNIADVMNITTLIMEWGDLNYYEYDLHDSMIVVDISNKVRPIGDIDNNGKIEINDLTMLIDVLLLGYDSEFEMEYADVDGDGNLSIADVSRLIDILLAQ